MESKGGNIIEQLQDITKCSICFETLRDHRGLPCIHTFCLNCLQKTHSSSINPGNALPCPICRCEFVIPAGGMEKLPKNFFIERVLEMTKMTRPGIAGQREGAVCDACSEDNSEPGTDDNIPSATMQCVECRQNLCEECCKHHKKNKLTKTHRIVALGERVEELAKLQRRINSGLCQTHPGKPLEIFCFTCETVACLECFFDDHKSHNCSEVGKVAENLKKQVSADAHKVSCWASEAKERLKQLGKRKEEFLSNVDTLDKAIISRKEELKRLIERQAVALWSQLETLKQRTIKELENDKDSLERHIAILESYTLYCNAVNTNGTASDICLGANELHSRADKLLQLHESFELIYPRVKKVTLMTNEPDESLKSCKNVVGKLNVTYKSKHENECSIQVPEQHETNHDSKEEYTSEAKYSENSAFSLRLLHRETSNDQWAMSGITHLDKRIYIPSPSSNSIIVHEDQEPFQKIREIQTNAIKSPVDIASCQRSNCLYITDKKSSCLWKISITSQSDKIIRCLSNVGEPHTLSVSSDGCVVMARYGSPSTLDIYSPDTAAVQSIELPEEVAEPQHAVRLSTGNYMVSYGKKDRKFWGLMEVTGSGQVVRCHDAKNTFQQLNGSYHLAIDVNDRVIVVDFYNNRVMLLDSKLNWARTLLTRAGNGIHSPKRLCFVQHNNQLIVKNRKTVNVYSFRRSQ